MRLQSTGLGVIAFGHVEDDSMSVQLWGRISINRSGGIMFEGRSNELACGLWLMDIADARLCVLLQFGQRRVNAFPVSGAHAVVTADKRSNRN